MLGTGVPNTKRSIKVYILSSKLDCNKTIHSSISVIQRKQRIGLQASSPFTATSWLLSPTPTGSGCHLHANQHGSDFSFSTDYKDPQWRWGDSTLMRLWGLQVLTVMRSKEPRYFTVEVQHDTNSTRKIKFIVWTKPTLSYFLRTTTPSSWPVVGIIGSEYKDGFGYTTVTMKGKLKKREKLW